jgi:cell division protein FtsB
MSLVRRQGWILIFLVAAVSMVALTSSVVPFAEIREQRIELENARARFAELQSQGDELAARLDSLSDPVEIERIARERLGYVRPGETPTWSWTRCRSPTAGRRWSPSRARWLLGTCGCGRS